MIVIASALLLYTIPSNIYHLLALATPIAYLWFHSRKQQHPHASVYFQPLLSILIGIIIATILYIPVLKSVIFNSYSTREATDVFFSLTLFPHLMISFISERYLLILLVIPGLWLMLKNGTNKSHSLLISLLFLLIFPFVLSFIHQRLPYQRVFIPLSPVLCILFTISILKLIELNSRLLIKLMAYTVISIYCIGIFYHEMNNNNQEVAINLETHSEMSQNIYQNYYLCSFFSPNSKLSYLKSISNGSPILTYNQLDQAATNLYFKINDLSYSEISLVKEIEAEIVNNDEVFVVTSYKNNTLNELQALDSLDCSVLTEKYSFTNIIRVSKNN